MPTISIGSTVISYTIEVRPRRRYMAIQVDGQQRLKVLVPIDYPLTQIEPFLLQESQWILRNVMTPTPTSPSVQKRFVNGETFWVAGDVVRLALTQAADKVSYVHREHDQLIVSLAQESLLLETEMVRAALVAWYRQMALEVLPARIEYYKGIVGRGPERLKISEYKSRWGYCRADGLIALNWRLVQAPEPVMDYVVVHELAHLRHPHHQTTFWYAVASILPNYAAQKRWLSDHAAELGAW